MKILVVDDEFLAREALTNSLKKLDCSEILEAKDGLEAYKMILEETPDIVLCDIRMPLLNGLDLQTKINEINKDIILIFISGYDLFEYAQKAISQNAFDYLLKPVSDDSLKNVLDRACHRLNQQNLQKDMQLLMGKKLNQSLDFMRRHFIFELVIQKSLNKAYIDNKLAEYSIKLPHKNFRIIIISVDNFESVTRDMTQKEKELLLFNFEKIFVKILLELEIELYPIEIEANCGFLVNYPCDSYRESDLYEVCLEIRDCINKQLDNKVTIGIGNEVQEIECLHDSYETAYKAVQQKIVKGFNNVHFYETTNSNKKGSSMVGFKEEQAMLVYLEKCDADASVKMLENLYTSYRNSETFDIGKLMKLNLSVILLIYKILQQLGIDIEEVLGNEFRLYEAVNNCESIDSIIEFFEEKLTLCCFKINETKGNWNKKVLEKAREFIQNNFARDITLEEVANHIHLSPNYFSKIFKQEFGHNFIDYLIICKINKAKELIKANKYKTNEICKMVGISDEKHFYKVFKKATGFTPGEYKNL